MIAIEKASKILENIDRKGREALHDAYKMAGHDSIDFLQHAAKLREIKGDN
jgi:hypothetical protein